jgi:AcrR family transcriptional regulator
MAVKLKAGGQLTRDAILAAAVGMIESDGVEALTMRKLADRCGAAPMSLYRHVATKHELLKAVADFYLAEVELPKTDELPWDETIKQVILAVIDGFEGHPHLADIMAVQHVDAVAIFKAWELIMRALRGAGFADEDVLTALAALSAYATGFVHRHAERLRTSASEEDRLERVHQLDPTEFSTIQSVANEIVALDTTERFERGLDLLIRALQLQRDQ